MCCHSVTLSPKQSSPIENERKGRWCVREMCRVGWDLRRRLDWRDGGERERMDWAGKDRFQCVWPLPFGLAPRSGVCLLRGTDAAPRRAVKARLHRGPKAGPHPFPPVLPNSSTADGSRILTVPVSPVQPFLERARDGGTAAAALASSHSAGLVSHLGAPRAPPFPLASGGFLVFSNPQLDRVCSILFVLYVLVEVTRERSGGSLALSITYLPVVVHTRA